MKTKKTYVITILFSIIFAVLTFIGISNNKNEEKEVYEGTFVFNEIDEDNKYLI